MGKVIAFPGQEHQVEEVLGVQENKRLEFFETHVIPFYERVGAIGTDLPEEELWAEIVALRDTLNSWIGGG